MRHAETIFARAAEQRARYRAYAQRTLGKYQRLVFFDFVSTGMCQLCLEKILRQPLQGTYFIRIKDAGHPAKQALAIDAFIESGEADALKSALSQQYFLLESAMMPPQGSLRAFDADGAPVFLTDHRTQVERNYIAEMQEGVLAFFARHLATAGSLHAGIGAAFADDVVRLLEKERTNLAACPLRQSHYRDDFCHREFPLASVF